jgi:hypothetical protein
MSLPSLRYVKPERFTTALLYPKRGEVSRGFPCFFAENRRRNRRLLAAFAGKEYDGRVESGEWRVEAIGSRQ